MVRRDKKGGSELFDQWPERYDEWFATPIGALVKKYETELLMEMLNPCPDENILDVGCGTCVFTQDVLSCRSQVVGLDISWPMLTKAAEKTQHYPFAGAVGDMVSLPFADESFDKVYSMTALEFVSEGERAVAELNRVARKGGTIVLTTLNSLSPWAERRKKAAQKGHSLFQSMIFRSPVEMARLVPGKSTIKTAIHFLKSDDPQRVPEIEEKGSLLAKDTGALLALSWLKV